MALLRQFYTNFTAGELSPLLSSRIDSDAYKNGVKTLRNFRIRSQGGITRRPGLQYLQTLSNVAYQSEPYVYDEDEAYIILFSNTKAEIVDVSSPTSIAQTITSCPWTTAMIGELKVAQSGDTMIIVHPDMPMQKLTRTAVDTFSRTAFACCASVASSWVAGPCGGTVRSVAPAQVIATCWGRNSGARCGLRDWRGSGDFRHVGQCWCNTMGTVRCWTGRWRR